MNPELRATPTGRPSAFGADLPAILAIAATYAYFLLFDQFAFLDLLQAGFPPAGAQAAMAAMGITGLLTSLLVAWRLRRSREQARGARVFLLSGFGLAAATAFFAPVLAGPALLAVAAATGLATALVTVPLAAALRQLLRSSAGRSTAFGLRVGLGTGIGYFFCNLPAVFPPVRSSGRCSPAWWLWAASRRPCSWCLLPPRPRHQRSRRRPARRSRRPMPAASVYSVCCFPSSP